MSANTTCKNCGKPVENTSGVLLHIRDGMEFVNETLPDKKRCFMFAALALPEAQPTPQPLKLEDEFVCSSCNRLYFIYWDGRGWIHLLKEQRDRSEPSPQTITAAQPTPGWISLFRELRNAAIHGKVTSDLLDRCDEVLFPKVPSPPEPTPTKKENA